MSIHKKLKWKKTFNEYKYISQEYKIIKSICREVAPEFQKYYENFLSDRGHDLAELNRTHNQEIKKAYGISDEDEIGDLPVADIDCGNLVVTHWNDSESNSSKMSEDEAILHNLFSKLFKQIAMKVHPDKIDIMKHDYATRRQMEEDFKNANKALDSREYFILIEIAEKLDIPLPKNYNQQTAWMKKQLNEMRNKINHEKLTYNYLFSEADTDEQRDNIIKRFVHQLFGLNL